VFNRTGGIPVRAFKTETNAFLQTADSGLEKSGDDQFIKIFADFDQLCPVQEDDGLGTLERGKVLKGWFKIDKRVRRLRPFE
jgi:hypothetical protein